MFSEATSLLFTYEVEWEGSDVRWASRWDTYLAMSDVQIHWFSIINSVIVVFFLSGMIYTILLLKLASNQPTKLLNLIYKITGILTMIIVRTLRRDIARYNKDDDLVNFS